MGRVHSEGLGAFTAGSLTPAPPSGTGGYHVDVEVSALPAPPSPAPASVEHRTQDVGAHCHLSGAFTLGPSWSSDSRQMPTMEGGS